MVEYILILIDDGMGEPEYILLLIHDGMGELECILIFDR